jgi:hypothetical protein
MRAGISIQFVWPTAMEEAAAAGAGEVEPGHVLCAALKLAEIDARAVARVAPNGRLVEALEGERKELADCLARHGVNVPDDSARLRRGLRERLRGTARARARRGEGELHRSDATRAVFARAEKAQQARGAPLTAAALVDAILTEPGQALAKVLGDLGVRRERARTGAPEAAPQAAAALGVDLLQREAGSRPGEDALRKLRRDGASKVVHDLLFGGGRLHPILLVADGERQADQVMADVARRRLWLGDGEPDSSAARIFEIDSTAVLGRTGEQSASRRLERLFAEAADHPSWVLWFDHFHRYLVPAQDGDDLPRLWKRFLVGTKSGCVLGTTLDRFRERMEPDPEWKRLVRIVWLHDVPTELKSEASGAR